MRRRRLPARALGALLSGMLLVVIVGACSTASVGIPGLTGPLLTVETRGGLCAAPGCDSTITIERDGRVHVSAKPPNDLGVVAAPALTALDAAIRTTDFAAVRSHPFTGTCPTAFDGQEVIFVFGAPSGSERISSCEIAIDYGSPLFVAVSTAMAPFLALPIT